MKPAQPSVLAINGGSSSIRFALYEQGEPLRRLLDGKVDRVGLSGTNLTFKDSSGKPQDRRGIKTTDHHSAVAYLLDWLETQPGFASVKAVGHRVVHGMKHFEPERVSPKVLNELRRLMPYDPEHLPLVIELIQAFRRRHPAWPQVTCFDTAFHRTMPRVATLLPIPRRYEAAGVRRYGFHGLSYEFLMGELARLGDRAATKGRVILAHLGNGASLAAVRDGKSIDTSMGFTPTAGLVMPEMLSMNAIMAGMVPVMIILMSRDMSAMKPISVRFWGAMSLAVMASAAATFPVNWWLVKRGLKYGMGGEERASLRQSVSAASKLTAVFLTLAMFAGGITLAARNGDFSMRAGDSTDTKLMSSPASVESGSELHR